MSSKTDAGIKVFRTVRFDLEFRHKQHDTEVRLAARAFVKRQGDRAEIVTIKRVYPNGSGFTYCITAQIERVKV